MRTLRDALTLVSILLLALGAVASLASYLGGWSLDYYTRVDQPSVALAATALFLLAIFLSLVKDPEDPGSEDGEPQ